LDGAVEFGFVVSLPLVASEKQRNELGAARKAADVGGPDHKCDISDTRNFRKSERRERGPLRLAALAGGDGASPYSHPVGEFSGARKPMASISWTRPSAPTLKMCAAGRSNGSNGKRLLSYMIVETSSAVTT